ncbi:DNA helicase RecQ [Evansella sp. AB-P1]|uniref:DNA helicase RecQ n=1 Tax=Evansella sp. AB-P1 TaxID=3037653 RepID=UPI00241CA783|nr:DNA helicase RecQ [Evansella sp. AB-P1]MDG5786025.1 DNA helicase RecQ [Evansella sp. AB-P1]
MIDQAKSLLKHHYGYSSFRPGQEEIILNLLNNIRTMGIMPTGGGKSICYQIPSLLLPGLTVVISPLISLMKDQVDELSEIGIPSTFINSSISSNEVNERLNLMRNGHYKLVYIAPERLDTASFTRALRSLHVSLVAIDEAHCLSQWGHDFRPSYMRIPELLNGMENTPAILALTATATPTVRKDICEALSIDDNAVVQTGFSRENLSFHVLKGIDQDAYIKEYLQRNKTQSGIIYAATRKEVERLYLAIEGSGISVGKYHGGLTSEERERMQEQFVYDEIQVMVATNAFGMGINKSNVRFVIHFQMPRNIESYYQEAGRAGRDGESSECILLFSPQDIRIQQFLIEQSMLSEDRKENEYRKLQEMTNYCHTESCLQSFILYYFGDTPSEACGKCHHCMDDRETEDVSRDAQMVFSCVKRMRERFGKTMVAQVLVGSANKKIKEMHFNQLSTYGLMKGKTQKEVSQFIDYLVASQYLSLSDSSYPVLQLTDKAVYVLKGEQQVQRKKEKKPTQIVKSHPLFEKLRELRSQLAKEGAIAPYMVFSDKTLNELCSHLPTTKAKMLSIKGVGDQKYERYGEQFLDEIILFIDENPDYSTTQTSVERNESDSVVQSKEKEMDDKIPSHIQSYTLYEQGKSLQQIAELRGIKLTTVESHLLQASSEGNDIDFSNLINKDTLELIQQAVEKVGMENGLKPIKESLPEEINYFSIRVCLHLINN